MDDIRDLINELPAELDDGSDTGAGHSTTIVTDDDDTPVGGAAAEEEELEEEVPAADTEGEDDDEQEEEEQPTGKKPAGGKAVADEDDDQSEYITEPTDEDDDQPVAGGPVSTIDTTKQTQDEFVLGGLQKMTVQVIGPDDKIYTVQAYGNGDLPSDMKGFASKYAEKLWDGQVIEQNAKARELIQKYQNAKTVNEAKVAQEGWVRRENRAIQEDLSDLIRDGIFPHFKGEPDSKEFNESAGGKEFTKVINYMQKENQRNRENVDKGRAYRHIGFREAYIMLNGTNPKAAEKAEDKARKTVAKKLRSGGGTGNGGRTVSTKPVANLTDLTDEFAAFIGSTK